MSSPRLILIRDFLAPHKREIIDVKPGTGLVENVPTDFPLDNLWIIWNGQRIGYDALADFRFQENDEIILRVIPKDLPAWAIYGIIFIVSTGLSFAIQALAPPIKPENRKNFDNTEQSPTYGWEGIQNTTRNGQEIGLIYGEHRVGGQYLASYTRTTDDDKHELNLLIGLGAGSIGAINGFTEDTSTANGSETDQDGNGVEGLTGDDVSTDLLINKNPGNLFEGVTVYYRLGSWNQATIPGFRDVQIQYDQTMEFTPNVAQTYLSQDDIQAIEFIFQFPSGLYSVGSTDGSFNEHSVQFEIRWREYGTTSWTAVRTETFTNKTRALYTKTVRIEGLSPARYEFEIKRTTAADNAYTSSECRLIGAVEIRLDDVAYNGIALVGVKSIATEQLHGRLPVVTNLCHGKKCRVYQPGDDFGEDTEQDFNTGRTTLLWGWNSFDDNSNQDKIDYAASHTYDAFKLVGKHKEETTSDVTGLTCPYFYKEIIGDFDCQIHGDFSSTSTPGDGFGLLVADSEEPTHFAFVGIENYEGTIVCRTHNAFGGTGVDEYTSSTSHRYLRVVRDSDTWTFYTSSDGSSWTQRGQFSYALGVDNDTTFVGPCFYSKTSTTGNLVVAFDSFKFNDSTCYSEETTSNPAWVVYDLCRDTHYGIGNYLNTDNVDLDSFISFASYCNELVANGRGGQHRRFRFDGVIDSAKPAWEQIYRILENYRAMLLMQGDHVRVTYLKPRSAVQTFTDANIKRNTFKCIYQTPKINANYWEVQFLNRDNDYEQDFVSYLDPDLEGGEVYRKKTIQAYGVTRYAEALRMALYRCKLNRYSTKAVSFEAGIDAICCEPYDVINLSTSQMGIGTAGRVVAGSALSVTLDKNVTIESGKTYQIQIRHKDDTIETQTVTNAVGTTNVLTVSEWTTTPEKDEIWVFGEQNIVTQQFLITQISRTSDLECKIDAIEYNAEIYDDTIERIPEIKYSTLPDPREFPGNVRDLVLAERAQVMKDGTVVNVVDVTYRSGINAVSYDIYYREEDTTTWLFDGNTKGLHYVLMANFQVGTTYEIAVVSVGPWGAKRRPKETGDAGVPVASVTIQGKTSRPTEPSSVEVQRVGDTLVITWSASTDEDLLGYSVKYGDAENWEDGTVLSELTTDTKLLVADFVTGTKYFMVKSINTSGLYSSSFASVEYEIPGRSGETTIVSRNEATNSWNGTKTNFTVSGTDILQDSGTTSCSYETPVIDASSSDRYYVRSDIAWTTQETSYTWSTATFAWSSTIAESITWAGAPEGGSVSSSVQIKYGDASPITSSYETFVQGTEYEGRYFQLKISFTNTSTAVRTKVTDMVTTIAQ